MAAAVRAGSELLGSTWVAEAGAPLGPAAEAALLRSAQLAAIHLICHRASEDVKRRTRGAFVREVLAGRGTRRLGGGGPVPNRGDLHGAGIRAHRRRKSVAGGASRTASWASSASTARTSTPTRCARWWRTGPGPCCPPPGAGRETRWSISPPRFVERVERATQARLSAGVGSSVPRVRDVPRSRRAAE
jgi:hypothetical protein